MGLKLKRGTKKTTPLNESKKVEAVDTGPRKSGIVSYSGASFNRFRNISTKIPLILVILLVIVVGAFVTQKLLSRPDKPQSAAFQEEAKQKVIEAMLPADQVPSLEEPLAIWEKSRRNMEGLARKDPDVAKTRFYAWNMISVCKVLSDDGCMKKYSKQVVRLSSTEDPYQKEVPEDLVAVIEKFGK